MPGSRTKLVILVGDDHFSFATTKLIANLIQDCVDKELSVRVLSEFDQQKNKKFGRLDFTDREDVFDEDVLKTCAEVDEKTTHVCVGRDEFTKSKIEEWRNGEVPEKLREK